MTTVVKTEPQHNGEFIVSEANGTLSREVGTLKSGEVVKDGRALALASGKLKAATGANTSGVSDEVIVGIAKGDYDASGGDLKGVVYIARLAEVKGALVKLHAVTGGSAAAATGAVTAELVKRNIISR